MKGYVILLLLLAVLIACGADDFEMPEEEPVYAYVHPLGIVAEGKEPLVLAELKEETVEPERISMPITDALRQLLFRKPEDLLDSIIALEEEDDAEFFPVEDSILRVLKATSRVAPKEITRAEYNFYNLLRYWKQREGQEIYYTRYVDAGGIIIVGSNNVTEDEFRIAKGILLTMTSKRPILRKRLSPEAKFDFFGGASGFRMAIIPENETLADMPEMFGISLKAHGVCGVFCASPLARFGYGGFVHEFGHAIDFAIRTLHPDLQERVQLLYDKSMAAGKYEGAYAAVNSSEYFAEGVKHWFIPWHFKENGTRQGFIDYDPDLCELLAEWLPEKDLVLE